jgi:hypothetical protein
MLAYGDNGYHRVKVKCLCKVQGGKKRDSLPNAARAASVSIVTILGSD